MQICITEAVIALWTIELLERKRQMKHMKPSKILAWLLRLRLRHEQLIKGKKIINVRVRQFQKKGWLNLKTNKQPTPKSKCFLQSLNYPSLTDKSNNGKQRKMFFPSTFDLSIFDCISQSHNYIHDILDIPYKAVSKFVVPYTKTEKENEH